MSGANEKEIINETNGQKSYYLRFKLLKGGDDCQVKVSLSPNDTLDTFVEKITPFFYDQNFLKCDGTESISCILFLNQMVNKKSASKSLDQTLLWNAIQVAIDTNTDCVLQIIINPKANKDNSWNIYYKPDIAGELPLYQVGSGEEAADPNKKHNQFQETDKFVELSLSPRSVKYNSPNISASNPLHRFIYSNHLRTQYDEGRLANAEGIFNRKLDSSFGAKKTEEKDGKTVTERVAPRGWQGIDRSKYLEVNGDWEEDKDARAWYRKLDDIILDKAYLSVNENLDTLISAANHFYEKKEITFEQFTNVMLMLRYAYELRQLPNDKEANELNSNPDPIKLSQQSYSIIGKIFTKMKEKLIQEFDDIKKIIDDNKELNLLELNNKEMINVDPAQEHSNNELLGMDKETTEKFGLVMDFVIKNKDKENELISKLKERKQSYIDTLISILKDKIGKKCMYDETGKWPEECTPSDENIKDCVDRINDLWESSKDFNEFIEKLNNRDGTNRSGRIWKGLNGRNCGVFDITLLLSKGDQEQLASKKDAIDKLSQDIAEHKKILDLETFKKCVGYVEMFTCAKHIKNEEANVAVELSLGQWLLNLLLSLGHLLSYRFYKEFEVKIDSVVNFKDKKDDIFSKFNKIDLDRYRLTDEDIKRRINDIIDDTHLL